MEKKEVAYLVMVCTGEYEDYQEDHKFVTTNKFEADKWACKFNKIICNNTKRIKESVSNGRFAMEDRLWDEFIYYGHPYAKVIEIELR